MLLMLLKIKSPMVSTFILKYLIILWIHLGKIELKATKRVTCKCIFIAGIPLRLTQCFPLIMKEGQVCIYLARKSNKVDGWLRESLKRIWVDYHSLMLYKSASLGSVPYTPYKIAISSSPNIFDSFCAKLESRRYFEDCYLYHISVCIWRY